MPEDLGSVPGSIPDFLWDIWKSLTPCAHFPSVKGDDTNSLQCFQIESLTFAKHFRNLYMCKSILQFVIGDVSNEDHQLRHSISDQKLGKCITIQVE